MLYYACVERDRRKVYGRVHGFDGDHGGRISESKPLASLKWGNLNLNGNSKLAVAA